MDAESQNVTAGSALHDLFMEVFALHEGLESVMDEVHEAAGMGSSQLRVAHTALNMRNATVPRIAEKMKVSRQFVQKVCDNLAWDGILKYEENPHHKRSRIVTVTDAGRKKLEEVGRNEALIVARCLPGIDEARVRDAKALLSGIRNNIEKRTGS